MLAKQHANLGVSFFIAGTAGAAIAGIPIAHDMMQPLTLAALAIIAGAFALMPDLDEPGSTVSRKFGPFSRGFSHIVKVVAFGHRGATHSLLFAIICGALGLLIGTNDIAIGILIVVSAMFIIKLVVPMGLGKQYYGLLVIASGGLAWYVVTHSYIPKYSIAIAMFSGVVLHCLGDSLTPSGTRFLWPLKTKFRWNINGRTGDRRETTVVATILVILVVVTVFLFIVQPLIEQFMAK